MELSEKQGFCYVWDQTIAKRGSNEIGSCLYDYLKTNVDGKGVREVIFFSDNCPGQNKKHFVYKMLSGSTAQMQNLDSVELIFLEKGHTQNSNDNIHSRIEQAKKGIEIHHPHQWHTIIQMACKSKPYTVKLMETDNFLDWNAALNEQYTQMMKNKMHSPSRKPITIQWKAIRHVRFEKQKSNSTQIQMLYKYALYEPFRAVIIGTLPRVTRKMQVKIPQAYEGPLPISVALKKDLMKLCKENAISPAYHHFYKSLSTSTDDNSRQDVVDEIDPNCDLDADE